MEAWIFASIVSSLIGMAISSAGQVNANNQNQQNMMAQWQREDTTLQRSRADAEAAGFSPLAGLAGQAGAGQLTTLQNPVSAFADLGGAFNNAVATGETAMTGKKQRALTESQTRYQNLLNDQQKLDNTFQLTRILKELDGIDLHNDNLKAELMAKLGEQIATGVISPEDTGKIAGEFNSINKDFVPHKNDYIEKDYKVRKQQADTAQSNVALGWTKETNRAREADREFNATNVTEETGHKISYTYGGITYEFTTKSTTSGAVEPAEMGLGMNVAKLYGAGVLGGEKSNQINWYKADSGPYKGKIITTLPFDGVERQCYFEGIYNDNGLPVVKVLGDGWARNVCLVPTKYGFSGYELKNSKNVTFLESVDGAMDNFQSFLKQLREQ